MKVDFSKEEREQLINLVQSHIVVITNLIQQEASDDTPADIAAYKKGLKLAQSMYTKLMNQSSSLHSVN